MRPHNDSENDKVELGDKPASVVGNHPSRLSIATQLEHSTRRHDQVGRRLLELAPGGVYPASAVTNGAVSSYLTISPLPPERGGIFSVALSRRSPSVAVNHHLTLWRPDFPRDSCEPRDCLPNSEGEIKAIVDNSSYMNQEPHYIDLHV